MKVKEADTKISNEKISSETKIKMLEEMIRLRTFEEKAYELAMAGKVVGGPHIYTGHEACAVGVCMNLRKDDYVLSHPRCHGHCLAKGGEYKYMMAELFGKKTGYMKGKGGTMHFWVKDIGYVGGNGIVGASFPISAGLGFASKYQGLDRVAVCFCGDGGQNTGAFHEGVNFASIMKAPVVYVCENNLYAVTVKAEYATPVKDISIRANSYNIPGITVDGNDVLAVYEVAKEAIDRARSGKGPSFLELKTYRWHGHWAGEDGDGTTYRSQEEIDSWKKKDPIKRLKELLIEEGVLNESGINSIEEKYNKEIEDAVKFAEESPYPEIEELYKDVFYIDEEGKLL
jgi:pyruvate dehydrogenase E1 component alpha subunit